MQIYQNSKQNKDLFSPLRHGFKWVQIKVAGLTDSDSHLWKNIKFSLIKPNY